METSSLADAASSATPESRPPSSRAASDADPPPAQEQEEEPARSDPILQDVERHRVLLQNEIFLLSEERSKCLHGLKQTRERIGEIEAVIQSTNDHVEELFSTTNYLSGGLGSISNTSTSLDLALMDLQAKTTAYNRERVASRVKALSDARELTRVAEGTIKREVQMLTTSKVREQQLEIRVAELKTLLESKTSLLNTLCALGADRRRSRGRPPAREEAGKQWLEGARKHLEAMKATSAAALASSEDVRLALKRASGTGAEPGLGDYLRLSDARAEDALRVAEIDLAPPASSESEERGLAAELVLDLFRENLRLRRALNAATAALAEP